MKGCHPHRHVERRDGSKGPIGKAGNVTANQAPAERRYTYCRREMALWLLLTSPTADRKHGCYGFQAHRQGGLALLLGTTEAPCRQSRRRADTACMNRAMGVVSASRFRHCWSYAADTDQARCCSGSDQRRSDEARHMVSRG